MQSIIKNITTTVLLVAILCLISLIGAQERKEGSEIKLVPVYEKTFAASVVDVIFDTVTVSIEEAKAMGWKEEAIAEKDSTNREIAISYPKVVIVSHRRDLGHDATDVKRGSGYVKEIRFYDKKEKLLNVVEIGKLENDEWDQIHISPNCQYILISHIPSENNSGYTGGVLYDFTGKKIREIKGPTPIAISDEGYMIAVYFDWQVPPEPGGSFYIYNNEGRLIQTIENPSKEKTAPLFAKYTEDGENAVLVFKATTFPPTIIYYIKKTGEIIWKNESDEYRFSAREEEMDINTGGIFCIMDFAESFNKLLPEAFFIDLQGRLKWKIPLEIRGNMIVKIADNGLKAYILSGIGYLWCIDIVQGKILWKNKQPWSPEPGAKGWPWEVPRFHELQIINDTLYIIGKKGMDWHSSTLFIVDGNNGELLGKIEYPSEKITFAQVKRGAGIINNTKGRVSIFEKGALK